MLQWPELALLLKLSAIRSKALPSELAWIWSWIALEAQPVRVIRLNARIIYTLDFLIALTSVIARELV